MHISGMETKKPGAFENYNHQAFGGTEYMAKGFIEKISKDLPKFNDYQSYVIPGVFPEDVTTLFKGPQTIIWLHNTLNQFNVQVNDIFKSKEFQDNLKYLVVVSEYHKQITIEQSGIDPDKIVVIQNAIDPIAFDTNKFNNVDKVKIIHASSPDRGMEVLLRAVSKMDVDFELNIFNTYNPDVDPVPPAMQELLDKDARVNFFGKTPRRTVLKYFGESHIHAYPTVWLETSCITQIEALAAGNYAVYSDLGSLKETSLGFGKMITINEESLDAYAQDFANELTTAIESVKSGKLDIDPVLQSKTVMDYFSWDKAKERWTELHDKL